MKIENLIHRHPCFFEDLRIASQLLEGKRPVVAHALREYADMLAEYDREERTGEVSYNDLMERLRNTPPKWEAEWSISKEGDMDYKRGEYYIDANRLGENWLEHMAGKKWVDMGTFVPAYIEACRRAGVKSVKVSY